MNRYESPQTIASSSAMASRRLDRGVLLIAMIILVGFVTSIAGFVSPMVRDVLMPRFGWIGLFLSVNSLVFIGFWVKKPTRSGLLTASFMTCAIGVINGFALLQTGTVDVVQNVFHDRIHSAWLWSVVSYLSAGGYFAFAAFRDQKPFSFMKRFSLRMLLIATAVIAMLMALPIRRAIEQKRGRDWVASKTAT